MAKVKVIQTHTGPCTCVTSGLSQLVGSRDLVTGGRLGGETMIHVYGQEVPHTKSICCIPCINIKKSITKSVSLNLYQMAWNTVCNGFHCMYVSQHRIQPRWNLPCWIHSVCFFVFLNQGYGL